jgi:hypothetical protein
MEHCVHLGAGAFIRDVSPTSNKAILKKIRRALFSAEETGQSVDLDALDADLAGVMRGDVQDEVGGEDDDDGDGDEGSVGDVVGKALALIKQVFACQYFVLLDTEGYIRSASLHKLLRFFNNAVSKPTLPPSSLCSGFVHAGHHYIMHLTGFYACNKYVLVYSMVTK